MWGNLSSLQRVFFCVAMFFTLLLIAQIILMIFGADDGDLDGDEFAFSDGEGFALFTAKGLISFFAVGGWMGFAFGGGFLAPVWVILIAVFSGVIALVAVSAFLYWLSKLAMSGTMQIENAVGKTAEVYLTVPANKNGFGKITVELQGRLTELDAMTEEEEPIKTGARVIVTDANSGVCYVKRV